MAYTDMDIPAGPLLETLFDTKTIRRQCSRIAQLSDSGQTHFVIHPDKLETTADFVIALIRERYPDLAVPYHSRWRHFEVDEKNSLNTFLENISALNNIDRARAGFDLIMPSVLVDAGAGSHWHYTTKSGNRIGRSEGLGVASLDMFLSGALSIGNGAQTDIPGLFAIDASAFARHFQVSADNPLAGVDGRVALLNNLAAAMQSHPEVFVTGRPGNLVDYLIKQHGTSIPAPAVLRAVIKFFGDIWPSRLNVDKRNLGDTWYYPPLGSQLDALVPFHKLSQWLSYSLIECLELGGITVTQLNQLTGLAEYRNGGLMLDSGLLTLRDPDFAIKSWTMDSELIIEWRALTIYLLDHLAQVIQTKLNKTGDSFPLAKVPEGGTWAAGRKLAEKTRGNLNPPLNFVSDGTVF